MYKRERLEHMIRLKNRIAAIFCVTAVIGIASIGRAAEMPLHADDSKIIQQIAAAAGLDAEPELNPKQGWPSLKGEQSVRLSSKEGRRVLLIGHDEAGRVDLPPRVTPSVMLGFS